MLVYAVLTVPCTSAVLRAKVQGQEVSTIVNTSELLFTNGNIVHTLAAKAMIKVCYTYKTKRKKETIIDVPQDFSEGIYDVNSLVMDEIERRERKQKIIQTSLKYNLVSQFTSFIAIEVFSIFYLVRY